MKRADRVRELYARVSAELPDLLPAITRVEAERAGRKLWRRFGGVTLRNLRARRCWVSPRPTTSTADKGWARLIHDVSHDVFGARHPKRRPHDPLHAQLEADVARYVAASGWLDGALRSKPNARPTEDERRARKIEHARGMLAKAETRFKRSKTIREKWARRVRALERRTP